MDNTIYEAIRQLNNDDNLDESKRFRKLKSALFGDPTRKIKTFVLVSPENPYAWEFTDDEACKKEFLKWQENPKDWNIQSTKNFKSEVKKLFYNKVTQTINRLGASYVKVRGYYNEYENSYLIFNITKKDGEILARNYGQESFFYGIVDTDYSTIAYYRTENYGKSYKLIELSNTVRELPEAKQYFSKFGIKWSIIMKAFDTSLDLPEIKNQGQFEESFSETCGFESRCMRRKASIGYVNPKVFEIEIRENE